MKKKLTRRVLSFVLAIVLMMAVVVPASAATFSWTSGGYNYVATVTEGATLYKYQLMPGTTKTHSGTSRTTLTLPSTTKVTYSASLSDFEYEFRSYLTLALNKTSSLADSRQIGTSNTLYRYVEAGEAAGSYGIYAKITCKNAPWRVDRNSSELITGGTLSYAPTATWTFIFDRT